MYQLFCVLFLAQVKKSLAVSPELIAVDSDVVEPKFSVSLSAAVPLQITLTKTSLQLIKTLVDVRKTLG